MLIHPLVVHFPIALWLTGTLFDVMGWRRRDVALYRDMAFWLVGLGLLGAGASILFGWTDLLDQKRQGVGTALLLRHNLHSWLAYAGTAVYLAIFLWRWRTGNRLTTVLLLLSLLGAGLVAATGYLGGEMRTVM
jgi:uncharacterized membrane protein